MTPKQFCEKYLKNYTINSDGTIDVNGNVYLYRRLGNMTKLPVKFGKVSGWFTCYGNNLTTLEGCPNYVGGNFTCHGNNLTTVEHCPNYVGGYFNCRRNNLTTVEYCPSYIGGDFHSDIITHHVLGNVRGHVYRVSNNKQRFVI
jgi:hypothetical protein